MPDVEPAKSAASTTSGGHSGWASTIRPGWAARMDSMSATEKRLCTSQWPFQAMILTAVCLATFCARYSSGIMITVSTPHSAAMNSTTSTALDDVQQMSDSAFTSADVLTYVMMGSPG